MNSTIVKRSPAVYGDVIGVNRMGGLYQHYGIYVSDNCVIEYATKTGDFFGDTPTIQEVSLSKFLGDSSDYFICNFPEKGENQFLQNLLSADFMSVALDLYHLLQGETYHLYTPEETVERAKSRLGEKDYNLATKNCEHFAIWCKTGISESTQVKKVLKILERSAQTYFVYQKVKDKYGKNNAHYNKPNALPENPKNRK